MVLVYSWLLRCVVSGRRDEGLKAALDWRQEFGVADIVQACSENPPNEMTPVIQKENETSKLYVRGYDKEGRALLYMRPAKENTHENSPINNMRHLVWNLEKAIACSAKDKARCVSSLITISFN